MANILVVEDDPVSQGILRNVLTKRNHVAHVTGKTTDAWSVLERNALIDLIILDNQLKGEYGWELLRTVRADFIFRNLPVIVCSGHNDRESVVKYLQLGVQNVLVKPYNAKTLEAEITRATQYDWRSTLFESADRVCNRLNIGEQDYYKSLNDAADDTLDRVRMLKQLIGSKRTQDFQDQVSAIQSTALTLGISILDQACEQLLKAASEDNIETMVYYITRMTPAAKLMQHRALSFFGLAEDDETALANLFDDRKENTADRKQLFRASRVRRQARDAAETTASAPFYHYARHLNDLLEHPLYTREKFITHLREASQEPPLREVREMMTELVGFDDLSSKQIVERIKSVDSLDLRFAELLNFAEGNKDADPANLEKIVQDLGSNLTSVVLATARLQQLAERSSNPLDLQGLATHSLAVALLAGELSRKFEDITMFMRGGLAHDLGKWVLALLEPAYVALIVLKAQSDAETYITCEKTVFSLSHEEVGRACLVQWGLPEWYAEVARYHREPHLAENTGKPRVAASMVCLANHLAKIYGLGFSGTLTPDEEKAFADSHAWETMKHENIEFPLEPKDYINALRPASERVREQIDILAR